MLGSTWQHTDWQPLSYDQVGVVCCTVVLLVVVV
jgi:hypothetical protein